jgi:hypothetical protein
MSIASDVIKHFFQQYEHANNASDFAYLSSQYAEVFSFGGSDGVQTVRNEDFLKVLPKRKAFFASVGLRSSKLVDLEETAAGESYRLVKTRWIMRFEKDPQKPVETETFATYVLFMGGESPRIVFQIDHQDLSKRAKELGLM